MRAPKWLGTLLSSVAFLFLAAATDVEPIDRTKALETFDLVWRTIDEKHFDPTFNGVDWRVCQTSSVPRRLRAETPSWSPP